jgi:hypothetical protein
MQTQPTPAVQTPAQRYRSPTVFVEAECTLNEFSTDQLLAELAHRNNNSAVEAGDSLSISRADISRIATLQLCGQTDAAQAHAMACIQDMVSLWRSA